MTDKVITVGDAEIGGYSPVLPPMPAPRNAPMPTRKTSTRKRGPRKGNAVPGFPVTVTRMTPAELQARREMLDTREARNARRRPVESKTTGLARQAREMLTAAGDPRQNYGRSGISHRELAQGELAGTRRVDITGHGVMRDVTVEGRNGVEG